MNTRNFLLLAVVCILFVSCSNNKSSDLLITFDDVAGYVQHPTLSTNQAHSGRLCVEVDTEHVYGVCYKAPFSLIAPGAFTTIHVSGWVKTASKQSAGNIVVGVDSVDQNIYWNAVDVNTFTPEPGKWTEINGSFDLKKVSKPGNIFVLYPMCTGKDKLWFDDLSVTFE
jgi:hypothetical protein